MIQEWPKTAAGWRRLALPRYAVEIIEQRATRSATTPPHGVVFGSPLGHLRDPSNIAGDLREVLDGIGCPTCEGRGWLTSPDGDANAATPDPFPG